MSFEGGGKKGFSWSNQEVVSVLEGASGGGKKKNKKKSKEGSAPEDVPSSSATEDEPQLELGQWSAIVTKSKKGKKQRDAHARTSESESESAKKAEKPTLTAQANMTSVAEPTSPTAVAWPTLSQQKPEVGGTWKREGPGISWPALSSSSSSSPSTSKVTSIQKEVSSITSSFGSTRISTPTPTPTPSKSSTILVPASIFRGHSDARGGGGRGGGKRGFGQKKGFNRSRPNPDFLENQVEGQDFVKSRPCILGELQGKQGKQGRQMDLTTNYYALEKMTNFNLFHYHIEFKPNEERTEIRKKLVKIHETTLGAFIFDGQALYTPNRIQIQHLYSTNTTTQAKTQICLRLVAEISPIDPVFLQVYNIIFRNILSSLDLKTMGRFCYDPIAKTRIPKRKLEIWPGYITSVRNHESQILLNLEVTHKVVRSDSVLDFITNVRKTANYGDYRKLVCKHLLGTIVVTSYTQKNYKIDDIKWDVTPTDEFQLRGGSKKSYVDYYKEVYGLIIKDHTQPMLVSLPKKKDYHRGSNQPVYLVPETCQMTGLSDQMRTDTILMKELANHLIMSPSQRLKKANALIDRWYNTPRVLEELTRWNIQVSRSPQKCMGRVVELEELLVGTGYTREGKGSLKVKQDKPGEWINIFKQKCMLTSVRLSKWVVVIPPGLDQIAQQMMECLKSQGKSMGFVIDEPIKCKLRDSKPTTFAQTIETIFLQLKKSVQMFVVLLPNTFPEVYAAIKKKCYCELGVSCQCVVLKTLQTKNMISITNRIAIQMNAKLGGEPWTIDIPLRDIMIIGYDVFHSPNKRNASVGALVASTSSTLARYYTSTYYHKNRSELSANLCSAMTAALHSYKQLNGERPPARIIFYRGGVGDGQLSYIYNTELSQIKEAIRSVYNTDSYPMAKFSFIVVTKRIHTRIFLPSPTGDVINPPPGTIVDDAITLPERYDFFLVSQSVNTHGTVSPTSYNVLCDEQGLDPDKMQRLTLKLCHLYFNFTGTIAVPAPCQFAHKLAYLTGMSLNNATHEGLQNLLYFL